MFIESACPTCVSDDWNDFGERLYKRSGIARLKGWSQTALSILFTVWLPDADEFKARFMGCGRCGLMIYQPRPTSRAIAAKYAFVGAIGDATPSKAESPQRTRHRANRIFRMLKPHMLSIDGPILDYGGGDGRLLTRFVEAGRECHLIDYADRPIPGVRKIGNTECDLDPDTRYAAIVCSHVVEHLPDPKAAIIELAKSLGDGGVMYVEVPYEMLGKLPAGAEPVTHVNFFTPASAKALVEAAGLKVISSRKSMYPHPNGGWKYAVSTFARNSTTRREPDWPGIGELRRSVHPSFLTKVRLKLSGIAEQQWSNLLDR